MSSAATQIDPPARFEQTRATLMATAAQCDQLCLKVGAALCDAVPALNELSEKLAFFADTLGGEQVLGACQKLRDLTLGIGAITSGLGQEGQQMTDLAVDNRKLAHLIEVVAEDFRYLSAMITNVKIEACSVDINDQGLQAFAENLARLASDAQTTIKTFQATHEDLNARVRVATKLHAAFQRTRQKDLEAIARDLEASAAAVDRRCASISTAASDIGRMTQDIGDKVSQCVLSLQVGDNIRQRVEHVGEALAIVEDGLAEMFADLAPEDRDIAVAKVCWMQSLQMSEAADEFAAETGGVTRRLGEIHGLAGDLRLEGHRLAASDSGASTSFLGDLEARMQNACALIDECRTSRIKIDDVIGAVAATFAELERLGGKVSAMVLDVTVIGINAIVRSHGLGQRGKGLSVIAQNLGIQAAKISHGLKSLEPAIASSRRSSASFADVQAGEAFNRMLALDTDVRFVLSTFDEIGATLKGTIAKLDENINTLDETLPTAQHDLGVADVLTRSLATEIDNLDAFTAEAAKGELTPGARDLLDRALSPLYTMSAERRIHADVLTGF